MATGPGVNQGKTAFVQEYFASHHDGDLDSVNKAWATSGHEGTVSESLVGKVRARMGLTGNKKGAAGPVSTKRSQSPAKPKKATRSVEKTAATVSGSQSSARTAMSPYLKDGDDDLLDELEEDIDKLILKIRKVADNPAVIKALRRARRLLVQTHEG